MPSQQHNTSRDLTAVFNTVDCSLLYNCQSFWDNTVSVGSLPTSLTAPSQSPSLVPLFHAYKPQTSAPLCLLSLGVVHYTLVHCFKTNLYVDNSQGCAWLAPSMNSKVRQPAATYTYLLACNDTDTGTYFKLNLPSLLTTAQMNDLQRKLVPTKSRRCPQIYHIHFYFFTSSFPLYLPKS